MDLEFNWQSLWRQLEFSVGQLWDRLKSEALAHPFVAAAVVLLPLGLWLLLKGNLRK